VSLVVGARGARTLCVAASPGLTLHWGMEYEDRAGWVVRCVATAVASPAAVS
jgi:hypothetical protein